MNRHNAITRGSSALLLSTLLFCSTSLADENAKPAVETTAPSQSGVLAEASTASGTKAPTGANAAVEDAAAPQEDSTPARETPEPSAEAAPSRSTAARPAPNERTSKQLSENEARARDAFRRGDQLYLEGDYSGAVEAFEEAYALSGRIEMLFNLANTFERLGNYSAASVALRGYIPHSPPTQRAALEKRLERFEALAEDKKRADENAHKASQEFPVRQTVGIGLLTLGGAALITGTAFAISDSKTRKNLDEICVEGETGRLCPEDAAMDLQRDKTYSIVADVSFAVAAALTATGLYVVLHRSEEKGEVRATATPGGFLVRGSF